MRLRVKVTTVAFRSASSLQPTKMSLRGLLVALALVIGVVTAAPASNNYTGCLCFDPVKGCYRQVENVAAKVENVTVPAVTAESEATGAKTGASETATKVALEAKAGARETAPEAAPEAVAEARETTPEAKAGVKAGAIETATEAGAGAPETVKGSAPETAKGAAPETAKGAASETAKGAAPETAKGAAPESPSPAGNVASGDKSEAGGKQSSAKLAAGSASALSAPGPMVMALSLLAVCLTQLLKWST